MKNVKVKTKKNFSFEMFFAVFGALIIIGVIIYLAVVFLSPAYKIYNANADKLQKISDSIAQTIGTDSEVNINTFEENTAKCGENITLDILYYTKQDIPSDENDDFHSPIYNEMLEIARATGKQDLSGYTLYRITAINIISGSALLSYQSKLELEFSPQEIRQLVENPQWTLDQLTQTPMCE